MFEPQDTGYHARVKASFDRQTAMHTLGISVSKLEPGQIELTMPYRKDLTQQHGFIHGGIISTGLDSACGYAGFSLMSADTAVLTIEFKINFLAPAKGDLIAFRGRVVKPGRTVTVCEAAAYAITDSKEKLIATMTGTLMTLEERDGLHH